MTKNILCGIVLMPGMAVSADTTVLNKRAMLRGPIPPRKSIDIWMDEFQRIIKKHRSHPLLMLWTVNNEMKFHVWHTNGEIKDDDALER